MTQKVIGVNFAFDHTNDAEKRDKFIDALGSAYTLGMIDNDTDIHRVNEWADAHKSTQTIGRIFYKQEGGMHLKPTGKGDENKEFTVVPTDYCNLVSQFNDNVWANIMNEPMGKGDDVEGQLNLDRLARWMIYYMDAAIPKKRKSVLFNWGDRNPVIINGMWEVRWHGLLKRASLYPDIFRIGMHFYGPDDMTEALEAYVKTCAFLNITPIPVVGTEFGLDSDAGSAVNGNRSRGVVGNDYGDWVGAAINGSLAKYIKSGVLVGLCIFTWSNHPDWVNFDMQEDTDLQKTLIATTFVEKASTPMPLHPFPADFALRSKERYVKASLSQFIRLDPQRGAISNGIITSKQVRCDVILSEDLNPDERYPDMIGNFTGQWLPIKCEGHQGWVFDAVLKFDEIPDKTTTGEIPVVKNTDLNMPISRADDPPTPTGVLTVGSTLPASIGASTSVITTVTVPNSTVKTFTLESKFVGTDEELSKMLEGMNLFAKVTFAVKTTEVVATVAVKE